MISAALPLALGFAVFLLLILVLERPSEVRRFWLVRTITAALVGLVLWKLTPVWTRWDDVFDHPLWLLSMNGGLAAVLGGGFAFAGMGGLGLWQVSRQWPGTRRWTLVVPVVAGVAVMGLWAVGESWAVPPVGRDPGPAVQTLVSDLEGRRHALADYRGRVVVVNFWSTTSAGSVAELPEFQRFTAKPSSRVVVLGVALPTEEKVGNSDVVRFAAEHHLTWTQLTDDGGELQKAFAVTVLPTTVVLDPQGRVVDRREGAVDLFWLQTLGPRFAP